MNCDVLLTEAGGPLGLEVLKSLSARGLRVGISDTSASGPAFASGLAASSFVCCPPKDGRNFILRIREWAEETHPLAVMPIFHPEVLSSHRDEFPGIKIICADADKIRRLDDKVSACALAASLGIRQPRLYSSPEDVDRFPVVFKRSGGHGGDSVYFPKEAGSLKHLVANSAPGTWLISDEIEGYDASIDVLRHGGVFVSSPYRTLLPRAKGISIMRETITAPELEAAARMMLEAVDYEGVCGMDFRIDKDGKAWFLECNPRFSGGLETQIKAGLDLPWLLWQAEMSSSPAGAAPSGATTAPMDVCSPIEIPTPRTGVRTKDRRQIVCYLRRRLRQGKLDLTDLRLALLPEKR